MFGAIDIIHCIVLVAFLVLFFLKAGSFVRVRCIDIDVNNIGIPLCYNKIVRLKLNKLNIFLFRIKTQHYLYNLDISENTSATHGQKRNNQNPLTYLVSL